MATLVEPLKAKVISESPLPPEPPWVRNSSRHGSRGVYHISSTPIEGHRLGDLKSRCGWRFGHIPTVVTNCQPPRPREFFFVCLDCARQPREKLYNEFVTSLKATGFVFD